MMDFCISNELIGLQAQNDTLYSLLSDIKVELKHKTTMINDLDNIHALELNGYQATITQLSALLDDAKTQLQLKEEELNKTNAQLDLSSKVSSVADNGPEFANKIKLLSQDADQLRTEKQLLIKQNSDNQHVYVEEIAKLKRNHELNVEELKRTQLEEINKKEIDKKNLEINIAQIKIEKEKIYENFTKLKADNRRLLNEVTNLKAKTNENVSEDINDLIATFEKEKNIIIVEKDEISNKLDELTKINDNLREENTILKKSTDTRFNTPLALDSAKSFKSYNSSNRKSPISLSADSLMPPDKNSTKEDILKFKEELLIRLKDDFSKLKSEKDSLEARISAETSEREALLTEIGLPANQNLQKQSSSRTPKSSRISKIPISPSGLQVNRDSTKHKKIKSSSSIPTLNIDLEML